MTRTEAFEVAKTNFAAHTAANIANLFHGDRAFDAQAEFGYWHGWYAVGEHSFNREDLTGEAYDITQGGWAFV